MMDAAPFRWTGAGILSIVLPDGRVHVKVRGQVVEDPSELAALGLARVDGFIRDGLATHELEVVIDGISGRDPIPPELETTRAEAEVIIQDVITEHRDFTAGMARAMDAGAVRVRLVKEE